jgi:phosphatidylserine/phosphatidylglycerophosphate/cardiolipin synthase-like enzyme
VDFVLPRRAVPLRLVSGRGHYETVIDAVLAAHTSVWIATANLKELMIEDHRARPGVRRSRTRAASYRSVVAALAELADRGVELRILHAEQPSRPFRAELARHPALAAGALALRLCPRVHLKVVVVDGALLYLGSANWTGAGLGARGSDKRNFELGIVTDDAQLLDQVQSLYDHLWRGAPCARCKLRALCPTALAADAEAAPTPGPAPEVKARRVRRRARRTPASARKSRRRSGRGRSRRNRRPARATNTCR